MFGNAKDPGGSPQPQQQQPPQHLEAAPAVLRPQQRNDVMDVPRAPFRASQAVLDSVEFVTVDVPITEGRGGPLTKSLFMIKAANYINGCTRDEMPQWHCDGETIRGMHKAAQSKNWASEHPKLLAVANNKSWMFKTKNGLRSGVAINDGYVVSKPTSRTAISVSESWEVFITEFATNHSNYTSYNYPLVVSIAAELGKQYQFNQETLLLTIPGYRLPPRARANKRTQATASNANVENVPPGNDPPQRGNVPRQIGNGRPSNETNRTRLNHRPNAPLLLENGADAEYEDAMNGALANPAGQQGGPSDVFAFAAFMDRDGVRKAEESKRRDEREAALLTAVLGTNEDLRRTNQIQERTIDRQQQQTQVLTQTLSRDMTSVVEFFTTPGGTQRQRPRTVPRRAAYAPPIDEEDDNASPPRRPQPQPEAFASDNNGSDEDQAAYQSPLINPMAPRNIDFGAPVPQGEVNFNHVLNPDYFRQRLREPPNGILEVTVQQERTELLNGNEEVPAALVLNDVTDMVPFIRTILAENGAEIGNKVAVVADGLVWLDNDSDRHPGNESCEQWVIENTAKALGFDQQYNLQVEHSNGNDSFLTIASTDAGKASNVFTHVIRGLLALTDIEKVSLNGGHAAKGHCPIGKHDIKALVSSIPSLAEMDFEKIDFGEEHVAALTVAKVPLKLRECVLGASSHGAIPLFAQDGADNYPGDSFQPPLTVRIELKKGEEITKAFVKQVSVGIEAGHFAALTIVNGVIGKPPEKDDDDEDDEEDDDYVATKRHAQKKAWKLCGLIRDLLINHAGNCKFTLEETGFDLVQGYHDSNKLQQGSFNNENFAKWCQEGYAFPLVGADASHLNTLSVPLAAGKGESSAPEQDGGGKSKTESKAKFGTAPPGTKPAPSMGWGGTHLAGFDSGKTEQPVPKAVAAKSTAKSGPEIESSKAASKLDCTEHRAAPPGSKPVPMGWGGTLLAGFGKSEQLDSKAAAAKPTANSGLEEIGPVAAVGAETDVMSKLEMQSKSEMAMVAKPVAKSSAGCNQQELAKPAPMKEAPVAAAKFAKPAPMKQAPVAAAKPAPSMGWGGTLLAKSKSEMPVKRPMLTPTGSVQGSEATANPMSEAKVVAAAVSTKPFNLEEECTNGPQKGVRSSTPEKSKRKAVMKHAKDADGNKQEGAKASAPKKPKLDVSGADTDDEGVSHISVAEIVKQLKAKSLMPKFKTGKHQGQFCPHCEAKLVWKGKNCEPRCHVRGHNNQLYENVSGWAKAELNIEIQKNEDGSFDLPLELMPKKSD